MIWAGHQRGHIKERQRFKSSALTFMTSVYARSCTLTSTPFAFFFPSLLSLLFSSGSKGRMSDSDVSCLVISIGDFPSSSPPLLLLLLNDQHFIGKKFFFPHKKFLSLPFVETLSLRIQICLQQLVLRSDLDPEPGPELFTTCSFTLRTELALGLLQQQLTDRAPHVGGATYFPAFVNHIQGFITARKQKNVAQIPDDRV